MTRWCPSCGGIIGRECFNQVECAWITQDMQRRVVEEAYWRAQEQAYYEDLAAPARSADRTAER